MDPVSWGAAAANKESVAETLAGFLERDAGEAFRCWREPFRNSLQGSGGDDRRAVGKGIVREAVCGVADDDLLLEVDAEPFGGVFVGFGEGERTRGHAAAVAGDGEGDAANVRRIGGADEMDGRSALAVDPFAVDRIEGPSAIESEAA